ncbi:MAG: carboxymuconolactone decarboxylase family protein [Cyanobacteria bacterium]|nr:carboxymuconolactone decarboxylase family protein [Cyanobacteriota bacterium]
MTQRLDYSTIAPEGVKAFGDVHSYVAHSGLRFGVLHLVYLRVSQINGCAYCIDMHTRDLQKSGVSLEKLALVPVWREATALFSEQERAALAWCETVTNVSRTGVPDDEYEAVKAHFSERQLVDLTMAIGLMNAYNRLAISFRSVPDAVKAATGA